MAKQNLASALACTGAVIGAGFASGREIVVFFAQYGIHAWWLIALAGLLMGLLCALCMFSARRCNCAECWCRLFPGKAAAAQLCSLVLMIITAGSMISAAGHMISLLWTCEWAYALGAAGTLWLAWLLSQKSLKPLETASAILTLLLAAGLVAAMRLPTGSKVSLSFSETPDLLCAALRAAGYAAMNMTLAIGVVCQCAVHTRRVANAAGLFSGIMMVLMAVSCLLYSRHPEIMNADFPLVQLLNGYGRTGFTVSAALLYLSVFTTLTAILVGLRTAVKTYFSHFWAQAGVCLILPAAVSCIGFSGIVESIYAPAGLVCLAAVYAPLLRKQLYANT